MSCDFGDAQTSDGGQEVKSSWRAGNKGTTSEASTRGLEHKSPDYKVCWLTPGWRSQRSCFHESFLGLNLHNITLLQPLYLLEVCGLIPWRSFQMSLLVVNNNLFLEKKKKKIKQRSKTNSGTFTFKWAPTHFLPGVCNVTSSANKLLVVKVLKQQIKVMWKSRPVVCVALNVTISKCP